MRNKNLNEREITEMVMYSKVVKIKEAFTKKLSCIVSSYKRYGVKQKGAELIKDFYEMEFPEIVEKNIEIPIKTYMTLTYEFGSIKFK